MRLSDLSATGLAACKRLAAANGEQPGTVLAAYVAAAKGKPVNASIIFLPPRCYNTKGAEMVTRKQL